MYICTYAAVYTHIHKHINTLSTQQILAKQTIKQSSGRKNTLKNKHTNTAAPKLTVK